MFVFVFSSVHTSLRRVRRGRDAAETSLHSVIRCGCFSDTSFSSMVEEFLKDYSYWLSCNNGRRVDDTS